MSLNAFTWPDGTPRSQRNAFDWMPEKLDAPMSRLESERKYQREYYQRKKAAMRVNKETNISAHCGLSNSEKSKR